MVDGGRLKAARVAKDWSQARLAKAARLTQGHVSKVENGHGCGVSTLRKLCRALGLTMESVVTR